MRFGLFVHMHVSLRERARSVSALVYVVQLITFDPRGAHTPALGTWHANAQGTQRSFQLLVVTLQVLVHHSPLSVTVDSPGFLQCLVGDAHLEQRVSRGNLRVEALRCTSPSSPVATQELIPPVEDSLSIF